MSKLVDKLNNLGRVGRPSMGFRTSGAGTNIVSVIVLAELTGKSEAEVKSIAGAGITAAIVDGAGLTSATLSKFTRNAENTILGLNLSGLKASSGWKLVTGDIDFVIFDTDTPVNVFESRDMSSLGKVLALKLDTGSDLLRSVHSLYPDIDVVCINLRETDLTVESLMNCRRLVDFTGHPVLAQVNAPQSEAELLALRGAGVKGIILPRETGTDETQAIVDRVAALPKPDKRKDNQQVALLPKLGLAPAAKEDGEGGGDDGDEDE
jgi:hypothetical protein